MLRRLSLPVAILLVPVLLLAGCGQTPATTTAPPTTTTSPPTTTPPTTKPTTTVAGPYGELRLALGSLYTERADPFGTPNGNLWQFMSPMIETMLRLKGTDLAPGIVEKWEVAPDGLSWTFNIHKGIKFHNGEDLTADDVKFSLERFMAKDAYAPDLGRMIDRVEQTDDYTLRIYTKGPQPFLVWSITTNYTPGQSAVVPKDYYGSVGKDGFASKPVGSGPFKWVRQVPGDLVEYEALSQHWRQTASFKKLTMILVPESTTRSALMQTGAADAIDVDLEESRALEEGGFAVILTPGESSTVMIQGAYSPQAASMPVADIRVRQALSLAVNRQEIINNLFFGKAEQSFVATLSDQSADIDVAYWKDYGANLFRYDPAEAKRLLKEAGYPDGFKIKLNSMGGVAASPYLPKLAEIIQGYWLAIGVQAEIVPTTEATWNPIRNEIKVLNSGLHGTATVHSAGRRPNTPNRLLSWFHTSGSVCLLNNKFPDVDKGIDTAFTEIDPAKRKAILAPVIKAIADSYTSLSMVSVPSTIVVSKRVTWEGVKWITSNPPLYAEYARHKS